MAHLSNSLSNIDQIEKQTSNFQAEVQVQKIALEKSIEPAERQQLENDIDKS